jgi:two-component system cell cycle sensor histidine kinase/response regulator CckA
VVDDEPIALEFCRSALARAGYTVVTAPNAEEALRRLQHVSPALALLDIVMPGMSGATLAKRIEKLLPATRIVLMSGYAPDEIKRVVGDEAAQYRCMWKPFQQDALLRMIRNVLDAPPNQAQRTGA